MTRYPACALVVTTFALAAGCRTTPPSGSASEKPTDQQTSPSALPSAKGAAPNSAAVVDATPPSLPKLKPILPKPFPEGADEDVVCEAISSKETDLWARFGHIVPLYVRGALYVLGTKAGDSERIKQFIEKEYVHPHRVQQASCGDAAILLYLRDMVDESALAGKPFGRRHLSGELEKRFGIQTRESFQIEGTRDRLAKYCKADAANCDALVRLDPPNNGRGLCLGAAVLLGISSQDDTYKTFLTQCKELDVEFLACVEWAQGDAEGAWCRARISRSIAL